MPTAFTLFKAPPYRRDNATTMGMLLILASMLQSIRAAATPNAIFTIENLQYAAQLGQLVQGTLQSAIQQIVADCGKIANLTAVDTILYADANHSIISMESTENPAYFIKLWRENATDILNVTEDCLRSAATSYINNVDDYLVSNSAQDMNSANHTATTIAILSCVILYAFVMPVACLVHSVNLIKRRSEEIRIENAAMNVQDIQVYNIRQLHGYNFAPAYPILPLEDDDAPAPIVPVLIQEPASDAPKLEAVSIAPEPIANNQNEEDALLDPISLEIMSDPVMTADGQTYDRRTITIWLATHDTSPLTGEPLANKILTPNLAMKKKIEAYLAKQAGSDSPARSSLRI